jgi:hypothetical protein
MLNEDVAGAEALDDELEEQRRLVVEYEEDYECAHFLAIVQGLLNHLFLPEVANLSGPYLKVSRTFLVTLLGKTLQLLQIEFVVPSVIGGVPTYHN